MITSVHKKIYGTCQTGNQCHIIAECIIEPIDRMKRYDSHQIPNLLVFHIVGVKYSPRSDGKKVGYASKLQKGPHAHTINLRFFGDIWTHISPSPLAQLWTSTVQFSSRHCCQFLSSKQSNQYISLQINSWEKFSRIKERHKIYKWVFVHSR